MADSDLLGGGPPQMTNKPGWQTTEFYVTVITACLPVLTVVFHRDFTDQVQPWAAAAAGLASAAYIIARSLDKQSVNKANANMQTAHIATYGPIVAANAVVNSTAQQPPPATNGEVAVVPIDLLTEILEKLDSLSDAEKRKRKHPRKKVAA